MKSFSQLGDATGIQRVEASDDAKHPPVHRTTPQNKELSGPKCHWGSGWEALVWVENSPLYFLIPDIYRLSHLFSPVLLALLFNLYVKISLIFKKMKLSDMLIPSLYNQVCSCVLHPILCSPCLALTVPLQLFLLNSPKTKWWLFSVL